jgi:hypothetical protein
VILDARRTALKTQTESSQGTLIGDLDTRIADLNSTLNSAREEINKELDAREASLSGDQKAAAEAVQQAKLTRVKGDLETIQSSDITTESAAQIRRSCEASEARLLGNIEADVQSA